MIRILVYDTTVIVPIFLCILTGWLRSDEIINDDKIFSILTISFAIIAIHIAIIMGLYSFVSLYIELMLRVGYSNEDVMHLIPYTHDKLFDLVAFRVSGKG